MTDRAAAPSGTPSAASRRPAAARARAFGWFGRAVSWLVDEIVETLRLLESALVAVPRLEPRLVVQQLFELGNRSLFFIAVTASFTGAILVIQACAQGQRILGDLSAIGPAFLQLLIREFGPVIVGMMLAARSGAGLAAQLATMQVTEQIDALRLSGADAPAYLVLPNLIAGALGGVALAVFGATLAFAAGGLAGHYAFAIGWDTYFRLTFVHGSDVTVGVIKAAAFGVAVPLVACRAGLSARGGAPGVGRATTLAVIGGSTLVLILDLVIGTVAHLVEHGR